MIARGPMLPFLATRDHAADARARLDVLSDELASGRRSDLGRAVSSDFSRVSQIAHRLRTHDAKDAALAGASTWLQGAQSALDRVREANASLARMIPAAMTPAALADIGNLAAAGRGAVEDIGTALNASQAGRPLFANGDPGAGRPLDVARVLSETAALASAAPDLTAMLQAFDDYFAPAPGAGIEAGAIGPYAAEPMAIALGAGAALGVPVSLADRGLRDALKQAALVAALDRTGFPMSGADQARFATVLVVGQAAASDGVTGVQARLGAVEERVARAAAALGDDRTRLEGQQAQVIASDPFETASRLQGEMTRLETIYAVTARRARLRLTDFIR